MQNKPPTSKARHKTPESPDRLTLEQYMQTYKIRKKIEQRNRSKSKGKDQSFQKQQQRNQQSIFLKLDNYLDQAKMQLTQNINNSQVSRQKLFFHVSKILDKLIIDLKGEISKLYKDVYTHYRVQIQKLQNKDTNLNEKFFKQKKDQAKQEMIRTHKADAMKEQIKIQNKNTQIIKKLLQIVKQEKSNQPTNQPQKQQEKQNNGNPPAPGFFDIFLQMMPPDQKSTENKEQKPPAVPKNQISSPKTNSEINKIRAFQRKPQAGFRPLSKEKR